MRPIVYMRTDDDLDAYVVDLIEQMDEDFSLSRVKIDIAQLLDQSKPVILHFSSLTKLQSTTFNVQAFLAQSRMKPTLLLLTPNELPHDWFLGDQFFLVDHTKPAHFYLPLLRMCMAVKSSSSSASLGEGLDNLVAQSLRELQRVKKLHEALVPMRLEKLKSMNLASKFAAGEASGGEFYDVIRNDRQVILLMSHAMSYLTTSIILSHFESLKNEQNVTSESLALFIKSLAKECRQVEAEPQKEVQLFVLKIDLNSLNAEGYLFGQSQMISTTRGTPNSNKYPFDAAFSEQAHFTMKFERGLKYCLLSPGVHKNGNGLLDGVDSARFVLERIEGESSHVLNEVFYQLKRGRTENFLDFDATAIIIEVNSHVIVQI
jgi:hypothetical protein